jgi:gliding motility-associated-like protein
MKKIILLLFFLTIIIGKNSAQNSCINADFSQGDFTNWTGSTGQNSGGTYINSTLGIVAGIPNSLTYATATGQQTIMSLPGTDPNTGNILSVLPPGGGNSCRLGNPRAAGCDGGNPQAERLEYTYTVTSTNCIFTYQYAVVLQDATSAGHGPTEVPKFTIYVVDSLGAVVDATCGIYEVVASSTMAGYTQCSPDPDACNTGASIMWKDWTTVSIDLSPYIGQNITIQFTTYDCDPGHAGGHFGYAYISCYCSTMLLTQQCSGNSDIVTAPSGFDQYLWSTGGTTSSITIPNPVYGDSVSCTMTSVTGCSLTLYLVLQIEPVSFDPPSPTICSGETAIITASGDYNYTWSDGLGSGSTVSVSPTSTTTYSVTGTSGGGCSNSALVTVTVNPIPIANAGPDQSVCIGSSATLSASGSSGVSPLTFNWSDGLGGASHIVTPNTTSSYTVTVSSGNGCSSSDQVTVAVNPLPVANAGPDVGICYSASTILNASGSTGLLPLQYHWSNGGNSVTQLISPSITTAYIMTLTDANSCTSVDTMTVTVLPLPTVTVSNVVPENCFLSNGAINIAVNGGTSPYLYNWNTIPVQNTQNAIGLPQGTYTVLVTDSNSCSASLSGIVTEIPGPLVAGSVQDESCAGLNDGSVIITISGTTLPFAYSWSTGDSIQNIANLPGGTYSLTVSDAAGCINTSTYNVNKHPVINLTTSSTDSHCDHSDGSASVDLTGGSGDFSYQWSNSDTISDLINILAGTYTVTVTDGFCTSTASVSLVTLPGPSVSILNIIDETCTAGNGGATAVSSGGTPGYLYQWSCLPAQSIQILQNVHAGNYDVTISDVNGCTATNNVTITNSPAPTLSVLSILPANCGYSNGAININVNGGTGPFLYSWNSSPPQYTQNLSNVPPGNYIVIVNDSNNCTATIHSSVTELPGPLSTSAGLPEICSRGNGSAFVTAAGGHGFPYNYSWSTIPPQNTQNATNLVSGTYTVTVDDGGCSTTSTICISNIPGPDAAFTAHPTTLTYLDGPVTFEDESNGSIITWQWTLGDGSTSTSTQFWHQYPGIGTYAVMLIVTDTNMCTDIAVDTINVTDIFTIYIPNVFSPNGDGINDLFFPQGINWDHNGFQFDIFDRWGNLTFHTEDVNGKWNGTLWNSGSSEDQLIDVYVYHIHVRELGGMEREFVGKVTLLK